MGIFICRVFVVFLKAGKITVLLLMCQFLLHLVQLKPLHNLINLFISGLAINLQNGWILKVLTLFIFLKAFFFLLF